MLHIPPDDIAHLKGALIPSELAGSVSYRLDRVLGVGGMSAAFFAVREAADGQTPVVLKLALPDFVREAGETAALSVRKEAVALGRLNERVPATPFVVRFMDTGTALAQHHGVTIQLPWLVVEFVHGGAEGTSLEQRLVHSIEHAGFAFDPERVAHAVDCLAAGLSEIHELGIVHRDLTPGNILCCGFGEDEIFKIADFGIARPAGMTATFGGAGIGTPGYAPPEQYGLDARQIGAWSDVFGMAALVFYMIGGEHMFPVTSNSPAEALRVVRSDHRRSILECRALSPELRERVAACQVIDAALSRATNVDPNRRIRDAKVLQAMLVPALRTESVRPRPPARRLKSVRWDEDTVLAGWVWGAPHRSSGDMHVRSVAWDGDARCMAATDRGLMYWTGTDWARVEQELASAGAIHFVQRMAAGKWLVVGDDATVALLSSDGESEALGAPDPGIRFHLASGDPNDLLVLAATGTEGEPLLYAMSGGRWVKPASLGRAASISSVARLGDSTWLVTGRGRDGDGFAVVYEPLMWDVRRIETPRARAYLAAATRADLGTGIIAGTDGRVVRFRGDQPSPDFIDGSPDLSAVAVDVRGTAFVAATGRIWQRIRSGTWRPIWTDQAWQVPIVSLFADVGVLVGVTADGGIVQGRSMGTSDQRSS